MFPIHLGNPSSEDQVDMASASQSRFRVLHEPRGRRKDDLLTKVAIDAATWNMGVEICFFFGGAGLYKFTHTIVSDSFLFLGGG